MYNRELIERYIYAVTKRMKNSMRKDVADELISIIQDMLDERCGDIPPTDRDVRVVLSELGTPLELYEKYDTDSQGCLIGPPYYGIYKYVMKIVFLCVTGGMIIAQSITAVIKSKVWYAFLFDIFLGVMGGLFFAFSIVTLMFAIFYKKGIKVENVGDQIDNLPPVPEKKNTFSRVEPIVSIAFSVIFAIVFLVYPQIVYFTSANEYDVVFEPIFDPVYIRQTWYFIILFAILGITKDSIKLLEGSYTKRLMISTVVINIINAILSSVWLLNNRLINKDFCSFIYKYIPDNGYFVYAFFCHFDMFFLGIVLFALILNTVDTIIKTNRSTQE